MSTRKIKIQSVRNYKRQHNYLNPLRFLIKLNLKEREQAKKMSTRDLEYEYYPSRTTKRFTTPEEVLQNHLEFVTKESDIALKETPHKLNIPYGEGEKEKFDYFYRDNLEVDAPIFVYIHGGYWQEGSKDISRYCVRPLVTNGFRVIILGYDLCPKITLQDLTEQIQKAARAILEYAVEVNAQFVNFCGHSAGAHLAAYLLKEEFISSTANTKLLRKIFLISGVYDINELQTTSVNQDNLLGITAENEVLLSPQFSDFSHLKEKGIAVAVYVAEHESETFIKQSREFADKLKADEVNDVQFKIVYDFDHFNIAEDLSLDWYLITKDIFGTLK